MRFGLTILLFSFAFFLTAQDGIRFIESISYDNAIALAKQSKKNIFIDTYADWCIPCKKMDIEFLNPEVSSFFNSNYINVRINMDTSPFASEYKKKFDIVFLPTMIILDEFGNTKYKTDKMIAGRELKGIASKSMNPNIFFESDASTISNSPVNNKKDKANTPTSLPEKIVYAAGKGENINPHFLFQEAYFRIELMDGSHHEVADRYLESQKDWSTPKNMRFIFDFLHSTTSKKFKYFVRNITDFNELLGEENVMLTLEYLVNDRLQNGYPRPTFEESMALYKLIDSVSFERKAYGYFLSRLINECNYEEYQLMGQKYLEKYDESDHNILFTLSEECLGGFRVTSEKMDYCIDHVKQAIAIEKNIPIYYESLARLYLKKGKKKKAKKAAKIAIDQAEKLNLNTSFYTSLLQEINDK